MSVREFPQYLSSPLQVLWFESDSMVIILMGFMIGNVLGGWMWLAVFVLPAVYEYLKKSQSRGFLRHVLYFGGLVDIKGYPLYFERDFTE